MILGLSFFEWCRRRLTNSVRRRYPGLKPRRWSNSELRRFAGTFEGHVVNVSAWRDEDKERGHYRDYFTKASSYTLTNYWGSQKENDGDPGAVFFDLCDAVPESLRGKFDVAFAHTVLEHVYDVPLAVKNIAELSRDIVILVVPFCQDEHYTDNIFGDYWRFTPLGLRKLLENAGMKLLYLSANDTPWYPIYLFAIASRHAEKWNTQFPEINWENRVGRSVYVYPGAEW